MSIYIHIYIYTKAQETLYYKQNINLKETAFIWKRIWYASVLGKELSEDVVRNPMVSLLALSVFFFFLIYTRAMLSFIYYFNCKRFFFQELFFRKISLMIKLHYIF